MILHEQLNAHGFSVDMIQQFTQTAHLPDLLKCLATYQLRRHLVSSTRDQQLGGTAVEAPIGAWAHTRNRDSTNMGTH